MKEEFNTVKPVEFTSIDGAAVQLFRADIQSLKSAPKASPANTIVTFKVNDAHPDGGTLLLLEEVLKVVDVLNGVPDEETVKGWEDGILEKRVEYIGRDISIITSQRDAAIEREKREYQSNIDELTRTKAAMEASLQESENIVRQTRYLNLASTLRAYGNSFSKLLMAEGHNFSLAYKLGGDGLAHVDHIARNAPSRNTLPVTVANIEKDRDMALARLQKRYDDKIRSLKEKIAEPQMTFEDKRLLEDKAREHRIAQTGLSTFLVPAPDGESFRPKADIDRENALAMLERLRRRKAPQDEGRDGLERESRRGRICDEGLER